MIYRCEFDRVHRAVRASGLAPELEELLNENHTGRPRLLSMELYLTGAILAAQRYQSTTQVTIHRVLTRDLARSLRVQHGLIVDGSPVSLDQVRYLLDALCKKLTPADGDEAAGEDELLDRIADRIVRAFLAPEFAAPREVAMDATAVKAFARGKRRDPDPGPDADGAEAGDAPGGAEGGVVEVGPAADGFAAWGYCTRTQDNCSSVAFGYAAHTIVGVPAVDADADGMPKLTVGLRLRPANADVVEPGLSLLKAAADAADAAGTAALKFGKRIRVMADRAWSNKRPERWAAPARDLGADLVFDLSEADRGALDHEGLLMVDGWPHCPSMPAHLRNVARPERFKVSPLPANPTLRQTRDHARATADLARFTAQIAERDAYAFRRVAGPDANGTERFECPAQAGKVRCEACPLSQMLTGDLPEVDGPPEGQGVPTCCTQRTITLRADVDAKRRQHLRWGTPEWIAAYLRRVYVEGTYGSLKSSSGANLRRGWCHARRKAKVTILLACAIAASNLALLRAWAKRTGNDDLPFCEADPPYHGFEELDADGNIDRAPEAPPPTG